MNPYFLRENLSIVGNSLRRLGPVGGLSYLARAWWGRTFFVDRPPPPFHAIVEITTTCNLRCPTCAHPAYTKPKVDLPFEKFVGILDQIPEARKISLLGLGEPLMHPELGRFIRECKRRRTFVTIFSNATLLTPSNRRMLFEEGLDQLHLSIDGATKDSFERHRLGGNFEKTMGFVRDLMRERNERKSGMRIVLSFTAQATNIDELPLMVRVAAEAGVREVMANDIHFFLDPTIEREFATQVLRKQREHAEEVFRGAAAEARKVGVRFYTNVENSRGERTCNWPWIITFVSIGGEVTPCCMNGWDPDPLSFGNIHEQPFREIWHSEKYVEFRRLMKRADRPAFCENCPGYGREIVRRA